MTRIQVVQLWIATIAAGIALCNAAWGWIKGIRKRVRTAGLQRRLKALKATMLAGGSELATWRTTDPAEIEVLEFAYPAHVIWHKHVGADAVEYRFPLRSDEFEAIHPAPPSARD